MRFSLSSEMLFTVEISCKNLPVFLLNSAFTHLIAQQNGNKNGAFFSIGYCHAMVLYGKNILFKRYAAELLLFAMPTAAWFSRFPYVPPERM